MNRINNERVVRTIPTADGEAAVVTDCLPFRQAYPKWRDMAASIGCEDIGLVCRGPSMLDWIEAQGEPYGPSGRAPRKRSEMRFEGIRILDRLCSKNVFDSQDRRDLEGLLNTLIYQVGQQELDDILRSEDSVFNPENTKFVTIDKISSAERSATKKPVYGHYRTPNYVKFRRLVRGKDELDAVSSDWYTSERMRGAAKPPVWQALFGDGTVEPFRTRGLLHVVLEGMRLLNGGIEIAIPSVRISGSESSEKAYRIGCLRRAVKRLTAQGRYTTKAGRFSTTAACRELSRRKFSASTVVESEIVKELAGIGDLEGDVVEFRVSISRRQMQKLAGMAGWKGPGEQGHDPVADFIEARWRKGLGEFNRKSELQSRLSRIIGRARAKELIDNEVEIDLEEVDFFKLHRMFLTKGQILAESNYRENRIRGAYPMFLPFGNIIRQMYYESAVTATTLRAGIIPGPPKRRRCSHCLKSGHDKRNCPERKEMEGNV